MKTARQQIDELLEEQNRVSDRLDRGPTADFINARRRYHELDEQIAKLCRESGERRVP